MAGRIQKPQSCLEENWLIWENRHHFLTMCTWDVLKECKSNESIFEEYKEMIESRISAAATEKLPG